jgi:hypothetical protein
MPEPKGEHTIVGKDHNHSIGMRLLGASITGPLVAFGVYLSFSNTHELVIIGLGSLGSFFGFVFGPRWETYTMDRASVPRLVMTRTVT